MTGISRLAAGAALLGLAAAGAAAANERDPHRGMMGFGGEIDFETIDTDGNGSLSRAELVTRATERLSAADTSGDGAIDRAELIVFLPGPRRHGLDVFAPDPGAEMADRVLALLGATEAGQVPVGEFAEARVNLLLAFMDTDRDAAISRAEAEERPGRRGAHDEDDDDDDRRGPRRGEDSRGMMMPPDGPPQH
jgi:hypothetical protein